MFDNKGLRRIAGLRGIFFLALSIGPPSPARALPSGRAWVPITKQSVPGYDYVASPVIQIDGSGVPIMLGNARVFSAAMKDAILFRWGGDTWTEAWRLGRGTSLVWPALYQDGDPYVVWGGLETHGPQRSWLVLAQVSASGIVQADTVSDRFVSAVEYAAAVGPDRRWAVLDDVKNLRLFYRDSLGPWNEVPAEGEGDFGVSIAGLDASTALVVWAGIPEGLRWGILSGSTWNPDPNQLASRAIRPQLRPRPSGGLWMAWAADEEYLGVRAYVNGAWTQAESLLCAYLDPTAQHFVEQPELTRDDSEYPSVAWVYQNSFAGTGICVCMSSDAGFGQAEELPGTQNSNVPTMARDRNGDLWLAWWTYWDGIFWTHTYTTATSTTPRVLSNRALVAVV